MKKWALGIGALVSIASPIAVAVSCGDDDNKSVTKNLTDTQKTTFKNQLEAIVFEKGETTSTSTSSTQKITISKMSDVAVSKKIDINAEGGKAIQDIVISIQSNVDITWKGQDAPHPDHTFAKDTNIFVHIIKEEVSGNTFWGLVLTNNDNVKTAEDLANGLHVEDQDHDQNAKNFINSLSGLFN